MVKNCITSKPYAGDVVYSSPVKVGLDLEQIAIEGFLALICLLGPSDEHIKSLQLLDTGKVVNCINSRWPLSKA